MVNKTDKGTAIQNAVSFWHRALLIPRITVPIPLADAQIIEIKPKALVSDCGYSNLQTFSRTNS